ncbi:hypothetical protein DDZ18_10705 [Marinicauda salina]|uniref:ATPase n=1 Tax=Marinicauda salina TaxID=2135793 RepID=A0A2U2BRP5_9PROT|nr:ATP12 family protein [Marinicauda salina]PWE16672.1 hypothetical protein DDZ18_10705 [Marinicauda salina]
MSMSKAKPEKPELPERFYETAGVARAPEGWTVTLDGRPVKTPARNALAAPAEALAEAMAAEWDAQDDVIDPFAMPLTRLAHVAIDRMGEARAAAAAEIARYASTDLLSHRAEEAELAARQAEAWDPYLAWAATALDAELKHAASLLALEQPPEAIQALHARATALDDWRLTGLASAVPLTGSAVLGFALLEAEATGEDVFAAATLDETFQAERWGEDAEAAEAAAARKRDLLACERLFRLLDAAEG